MNLDKLKKAIDFQKELIIDKLIARSENGEELSTEELGMLERFYDANKED